MRSLCLDCGLRRAVQSGTGSVFTLCRHGLVDPAWPKYPPQPVGQCPHHRWPEAPERGAAPEEPGSQSNASGGTEPPRR